MCGGIKLKSNRRAEHLRSIRRRISVVLIAAFAYAASDNALRAQVSESAGELQFDIPSQPLATALREYSRTTGLEVFYDGSLSIGHRSSAVRGAFTPTLGLKTLLRGTGYVARTTEISNAVTIVSAPSVAPLQATFARYDNYFAVLQARLSEALCPADESSRDGKDVTFRFWLSSSGVVSNVELLGEAASSDRREAVAAKLQGLQIGKIPPAGLPQPLTMVIYPPAPGEAECPSTSGRHAGN
jgi:hypothetical protein